MSDTTGATERSTARVPQRWVSAARTVVAALVHSNLYISTAAASVAVSTMLLSGYPLEAVPAAIVFAATMFVYSLNRITDLDEDEQNVPRRAAFTRRYGRPVLALSVCGYLGAVALALAWGLPRVEFMALPPLVGGLYSLGRLKRLFLVKNLLVGAAWGVIPLGVPVYFGADPTVEVAVFAGYVAVMLTVAAVVFDIKDIEGDRQRGIRTVPVRFGPRVTRVVAGAVTVAAAGVVAGLVVAAVLPRTFLALLAATPTSSPTPRSRRPSAGRCSTASSPTVNTSFSRCCWLVPSSSESCSRSERTRVEVGCRLPDLNRGQLDLQSSALPV